MPLWYRSVLLAEDALLIANTNLDIAHKMQSRKEALKLCDKAETALRRIDISADTMDQPSLDQIIVAFREHGRVLEKWNLSDKALKSYNKAKKLEVQAISSTSASGVVASGASGLSVTPVVSQSPTSLQGMEVSSQDSSTTPDQKLELIPASIFAKDFYPYAFNGTLPEPDKRLDDTRQLVHCLALLKLSDDALDALDAPTRIWLQATNEDERERLKDMAKALLLEFARDKRKDAKITAEIVCLAPVLESDDFRFLLKTFVDSLSSPGLLDTHALEGLNEVIKSAPRGGIDSDDLVKILEYLNSCLQGTHEQSLDHMYRLTRVVSHVLDAMADGDVKGLDRESLHTPLLTYLQKLKKSTDPYMVFQAAYAYQALLFVPNNEEPWEAALRCAWTVTKGVTGLVSAVKGFNVVEFIEGLRNIQEGLEGAGQAFSLVTDLYKGAVELTDSVQVLQEPFKGGLSFRGRCKWYPALRATDALLRSGKLIEFKSLVYGVPCRRDQDFQLGVCQQLGQAAVDPLWDTDARQGAIAFLGDIYRNDATWGQEVQVKQCILSILMHLAFASGDTMQAAKALLQGLEQHGDATTRSLYQVCRKDGHSSNSWKVVLPLLASLPLLISSPLLNRVQKKPDVHPSLRRLQRQQQYHRSSGIYIPPQAKASRQASDDDLFDLTDHVKEFLCSDQRVLLLLGDSGAGKSTFTKELERELWDEYTKHQTRIPIFVSLPAMEKPEHDIIGRQLKGFSEAEIQELRDNYEFVLICDGYDEYQHLRNLYSSNQLNQPGQWKAQMVISCRSEYLGYNYQTHFLPENSSGRKDATLLREVVIAPFSTTHIQHYIEKYVVKESPPWKAESYLEVIRSISGLQELVRNPFLLTVSLKVLPRLVDRGQDLSSTKIARVTLYDEFVELWVQERGHQRLTERELTEDKRKAFADLCDDHFTQSAIRFVKDFAVAIFDHQDGRPIVEYSRSQNRAAWKDKLFKGDETSLLREASPISRNGNQYEFIHRSVLEYGLARAVFEPTSRGKDKLHNADPATCMDMDRSPTFVDHRTTREVSVDTALIPDSNSPLFRRKFVNVPSIVQFLAERVQQEPIFEKELLSFIGQSKTDKAWSIAAANAITILVRAGIRFNGVDLRDISISGADLSGGEFDSAQLQGSDLSNATLRNIWLRQANLDNALMEGVQFGELPYLKEDSGIHCCAYSPDKKACVFGLLNGKIRVYDTSTWAVTLTLQIHASIVTSVVYSPSGQQIASDNPDNTVRLWDVQTGAAGLILSGHTGPIASVVYSHSGEQIASSSHDKTVRLWDAHTGEPGHILRGHTGVVRSVVYSPNGHQIVSCSFDDTVRLWEAQTGELVYILSGHTGPVTSVVYSPSGQQIASSSEDKTVRLWDVQTGAAGPILSGHTGVIDSIVYSPSGHQIASGSFDSTVRLWDAETGALSHILSGHSSGIASVVYSSNGHQIASGSSDRTVRLWDAQAGIPGPIFSGHTRPVSSVMYSRNGHQLISCSGDSTVRLWDAQAGASDSILSGHANVVNSMVYSRSGHTNVVNSVVYSPSGHQVASGSWDNTVRLWDTQSGAPDFILSGHSGVVRGVVYSPSGQQIASCSGDKTVRLWDAQTGTPGHILSDHTSGVRNLVYSSSGHQIASCSFDKTVRLWDAQTGERGHILGDHTGSVTSVVYSPDDQQIASCSGDKTIRLWDAQTGASGYILSGHTDSVTSVAYSPNGLQIASGSFDSTVQLWDVQTGEPVYILSGHTGTINSVVYSPGGHQVASCSEDKTVRLWDAQTGAAGFILSGHTSAVNSVVYSPSGMQIASGSYDNTVRLWDTNSGRSLAVVEDFRGSIVSVAWNGTYFITGCEDRSVRMWQVVEEDGRCQVRLRWSSMHDGLIVTSTFIQNVKGLSSINKRLLIQRGAVSESTSP